MAKEIERKYCVKDLKIIERRLGLRIIQGYIADCTMTVRVRIIEGEAFLTLKGKTLGIERDEYEFPIPLGHARELLERYCGTRIIEKTRYRIPHRGLVFEVDVFGGKLEGLVIAEVELDAADQAIDLPAWIGTELSHDRRFSNNALSLVAQVPDFLPQEAPMAVV